VKKLIHPELHDDVELELATQVQGDNDCMEMEIDFTSPLFNNEEEFHAELHCAAELELASQV